MKQEIEEAGEPDENSVGIQHSHLLLEEGDGRQFDIFVCGFDVAQVFERGEVVNVLPDNVGQSDAEGDACGEPEPFGGEQATLWRKQ